MKMNKQKQEQVFGTIEKVEVNKDYQGKETKTAKVTVNNIDREISVDVNFTGMLGTTPTTAFPGHLGVEALANSEEAKEAVISETLRAKEQEEYLSDYIKFVREESSVGDGDLHRALESETERAKSVESNLSNTISDVYSDLIDADQDLKEELLDTLEVLEEQTKSDKFELRDSITKLSKRVDREDAKIIADLRSTETKIETTIVQLTSDIDNKLNALDDKHTQDVSQLADVVNQSNDSLNTRIDDLSVESKSSDNEIIALVNSSVEDLTRVDTGLRSDLTDVKQEYAKKSYVYEQLVEFTKLSKQIVDGIDLDQNKIIIQGEFKDPTDGILYLMKKGGPGPDFYDEYTTIDEKLTLIGDTSVSLEGYATETWVEDKNYLTQKSAEDNYATISSVNETIGNLEKFVEDSIKEIDLTPYVKTEELPTKLSQFENDVNYAKKEEIPDISHFITAIPEEYVTDTELIEKGYYTLNDITSLLSNIEFIDGGTSSSLNI